MKTKLKSTVLFILILTLTALLCSCRGASAYEIAKKHGFTGTETEWLDSLKGERGLNGKDGEDYKGAYDAYDLYLTAKEKDGFEGSFSDFVKICFSDSAVGSYEVIARSLFSSCKIVAAYETASGGAGASLGSGVIYSIDKENGDAYIITNYHIVYKSAAATENHIVDSITAYLYGSELKSGAIECKYVGGTANYDLALLKVEGSAVLKNSAATAVTFGDSNDVTLGETVYAIGNAEGEGISVTKGIVSVDSEQIDLKSDAIGAFTMRALRFDAAISPGNSGGGVFNGSGKLIGVCNSKTVTVESDGMGYAIPSVVVERVIDKLINQCDGKENENLYKPMFGVVVATDTTKGVYNAEKSRIDIVCEVYISDINEDSPVKDVFKVNDKLITVTAKGVTKEVTRHFEVVDILLGLYVGDVIEFTIERNSVRQIVSIVISESMMTKIL